MPKKPNPAATAGNDDDMLVITVSSVAKAAGVTFRPGREYTVKRKVLVDLGDAVASEAPAPEAVA
jgi:hypothetical protein